ncbi:MAG: hypothetical protein JWN62_2147 [Acidimicrobiales bacterium]|nr:hypothetical protein [Acidimicrobiales bacterium]
MPAPTTTLRRRYRIEATGLTRTAAKALVKTLTAAKFFAFSVRL